MATEPTYVIVGASLAGAKAAETLREEGFSGGVVLLGEENERPYERPPLSKGYLLGKDEKSSIYVHEEGWYAEHDVDLRLGRHGDRARPGRPAGRAGRRRHGRLRPAAADHRRGPAPAQRARGRPGRRGVPAPGRGQRAAGRGAARRRPAWSSSARAGSGSRWPPPPGSSAARSPWSSRRPGRCTGTSGRSWRGVRRPAHRARCGVPVRGVGHRAARLRGRCEARRSRRPGRRCPPTSSWWGSARCPRSSLASGAGLDVGNGVIVDAGLHTSAPGGVRRR